jgi:hypothetical protein
MKKIFLLSALLFQLTIVIGQTKTENKKGITGIATGGIKSNRQVIPAKSAGSNDKSYRNDCYKSFAFTLKNYGYNKDGHFYSWGVKVTNNYSKAVQLKYKLIVGNDNSQNGTLTYYIKPGETYSNDFGSAKAIIVSNSSDQYTIEVSEVCFEGLDCNTNGYVACNGRQKQNNSKTSSKNTPIASAPAITPPFFAKVPLAQSYQGLVDELKKAGFNYKSDVSNYPPERSQKYLFEGFKVNGLTAITATDPTVIREFDNLLFIFDTAESYNDFQRKINCEDNSSYTCKKIVNEGYWAIAIKRR